MASDNRPERPDPDDNPWACSICGQPIGLSKRIEGEDYCDVCLSDYGIDESECRPLSFPGEPGARLDAAPGGGA